MIKTFDNCVILRQIYGLWKHWSKLVNNNWLNVQYHLPSVDVNVTSELPNWLESQSHLRRVNSYPKLAGKVVMRRTTLLFLQNSTILAAQPGPKGQLFCLYSFKIFWDMKPSYSIQMTQYVAHFILSKNIYDNFENVILCKPDWWFTE